VAFDYGLLKLSKKVPFDYLLPLCADYSELSLNDETLLFFYGYTSL
jgi:hypothetical protein